MLRCFHAHNLSLERGRKRLCYPDASPCKTTAWEQSVAEPQTIFTRERQSQLCFSRVLYNCSLKVQLFWSWPHILSAKAPVDTIYGVVWGSMLSNVRWNHKGGLSGPNRVHPISVEVWTSSPKTACVGYGYLKPKSETTMVLLFYSLCMWSQSH